MNSPSAVISASTTYEINIGGVPYHSASEIARTHGYVRGLPTAIVQSDANNFHQVRQAMIGRDGSLVLR
jgi:hypothetical protein